MGCWTLGHHPVSHSIQRRCRWQFTWQVVVPVRCQSTTQEPLWVQLMIYSLCRSAGSWAPATVHHSTCASCSRPADGMDAGVACSSGAATGGGQSSGLEAAFTSVLVATPGAGSSGCAGAEAGASSASWACARTGRGEKISHVPAFLGALQRQRTARTLQKSRNPGCTTGHLPCLQSSRWVMWRQTLFLAQCQPPGFCSVCPALAPPYMLSM